MYAELHCHSYFSLLDGASSPEHLVSRAKALGLRALALTDHDSLAGAVRFWNAARVAGLPAIIGAEVTLESAHGDRHLTLLAESQRGHANLCRLITQSRQRAAATDTDSADEVWAGKVEPRLPMPALDGHAEGLIALTGCRNGAVARALLNRDDAGARAALEQLRDVFGHRRVFVELQDHFLPDDRRLIRAQVEMARALGAPCVVTNNVHYATGDYSRLRDVLIATRHLESLDDARRNGHLPLNSAFALAAPAEMAARFDELPEALSNTLTIAERCTDARPDRVSLDFAHQRLPHFPTPHDASEFACLYRLCHEGLPQRYPELAPRVLTQLAHELSVIEGAGLAGYFLIVWDIARFARERGIRCQGRGSAANSLVAYLLGITAVDPLRHNLLFERFLSPDQHTIPDIDIDFAADRREEVIQYVYDRYGASHVAMACNVVTYHARSAIHDIGRALDFPPVVIERLSRQLETNDPDKAAEAMLAELSAEEQSATSDHPLRQLADLLRMIDTCPRHLSIHSGGVVITGPPLDEVVPLEPATMPGRVVTQWNKDSLEDAGLIKIDLLSLRALSVVDDALRQIEVAERGSSEFSISDDPAIYDMIQRADTIGAFQIESRAQQQTLPRTLPANLEDLAVEIAIIRPGPIQGGAVHPYMRRRAGLEPVSYWHPSLEPILKETLGVLLFQEQVIRVAMATAKFSAGEADALRRAMSRARSREAMVSLRERYVAGAVENGLSQALADDIFDKLAGFAGYGFCKSHAASFALIAYQTMWLKKYHPAEFFCALLNNQPMGFYSPEVLIGDAKRHNIPLLSPDINRSAWNYTVERTRRKQAALRAGLNAIAGLSEVAWRRIESARSGGAFAHLRDVCARARLPHATMSDLIRAGALDAMGERRALLWQLGEIHYDPDELPLDMPRLSTDSPELPALGSFEQMMWDYELTGASADGHPMKFYRPTLRRAGVMATWEVKQQAAGRRVRVAGAQAIRQRPATAKGMVFISMEDETGLVDLVVRPDVYERLRKIIRGSTMLLAQGVVQRAGGSVNVLVSDAQSLGAP